jgi:hypothetical protein
MSWLARIWEWLTGWFTKGGREVKEMDELKEWYVGNLVLGVHEDSLDKAILHGYEQLADMGGKPPFRVVEIFAAGTNPFSGYIAVMRGDG